MKSSRAYVMRARAESVEQTRARIVRAAVDVVTDTMSLDVGLAEVAERAGTSVQTILRHFGSREGLLQAAGDWVLAMLAREGRDQVIREMTDGGRQLHRDWVAASFAPQLAARPAGQAAVLADLLVVATDVYTWKLLRRDGGLSVAAVEQRMLTLVSAICEQEA